MLLPRGQECLRHATKNTGQGTCGHGFICQRSNRGLHHWPCVSLANNARDLLAGLDPSPQKTWLRISARGSRFAPRRVNASSTRSLANNARDFGARLRRRANASS